MTLLLSRPPHPASQQQGQSGGTSWWPQLAGTIPETQSRAEEGHRMDPKADAPGSALKEPGLSCLRPCISQDEIDCAVVTKTPTLISMA